MNEGMSAMGSDTRQGIDMAVSLINGLISGDMTGAAASEIGAAVSINVVDVLMAEGLTAAESKAFLESLNLEQRRLIELALVDPMGDQFLEDAVLKTYERYYNDYLKEKGSKKDNDNPLTGTGSSSAGGASGLPPDDDNRDKNNNNTQDNVSRDPNEIKHTYNSIKDSPNYPKGFRDLQNGTVNNTVKEKLLLEQLRKIEPGRWSKVYKDGYDVTGNKISIHYFRSQSGRVFNVKVKKDWSNL
ncbi:MULTISPECIES: hypothetical protein [unclassified Gilliamella]|uniref:hypothetical protein n=1 Tax=unclassified Gilliamella TaxID=2685620 RepID=UPI00094CFECD|nr:hypothetical protein [Gilliamella apicola]